MAEFEFAHASQIIEMCFNKHAKFSTVTAVVHIYLLPS